MQILDTLDDFRATTTMPRDFMASLDGSMERMLQGGSGKSKTFLRKGHGHITKKFNNWERTSVSSFSMSKTSSSKKLSEPEQELKSTFQSPNIRQIKETDTSPNDFMRTQKVMTNFLNSHTAEKSAQDIAHRITTLKDRYAKPTDQPYKKPVLTTRHRIPNNEDLILHLSHDNKKHSSSLSSTQKLLSIREE